MNNKYFGKCYICNKEVEIKKSGKVETCKECGKTLVRINRTEPIKEN